MSERSTWRFPTLRGHREIVLGADLVDGDSYRVISHTAVRGEARSWALDPLTRDAFRDMHAALAGHDPAGHCAEGVDALIDRVERAFEARELVALRVPALVVHRGAPAEDPEEPAEPGEPPETPPDDDPRIVSVQWVEGAATVASGTQWVNLPREAKWADGARVTTQDRCGNKPWIKVVFDRPGAHHFKIKLVPSAANPVYTGAEKGRNPSFVFEEAERDFNTGGDGTRVLAGDLALTVAGKSSWALEASDDYGHTARSGALAAKRLVYYLEIPMQGLASVATSVSTMTGEFANHDVVMVSAGRQPMVHMPNISTTDSETFKTNARTAYQAAAVSAKEPYLVAIAYTDHLAVKDAGQVVLKTGVTVGPTAAAVDVPIVNAAGANKYLWNNLVPGEGWFVSGSYQADAGGAPVAIAAAKCTAVASDAAVPDKCRTVRVDVTALPPGTGTVTLTVNWVNRMRGGLSFSGGNLVCICTRAWWRTESTADQNQTIIHEVGHHVGMVPDGTGTTTDAPATQYTGSGHIGSHCHNGVAQQASYANAAGSTCVMFGAGNGVNAFCANCQPGVRKNDLTAGWAAF